MTKPRTPSIRRPSGRSRIVAWVVAVTGLGLLLLIVAASFVARHTAADAIRDSVNQEVSEIRRFSESGVDPLTGERFTAAAGFVEVYLARQQTGKAELMIGGVRGSGPIAEQRGPAASPFAVFDPATQAQILAPSSAGTIASPVLGEVTWRTVEIEAPDGAGFISVIHFHEPGEAATRGELGVLGLLALGALISTGAAAWVVAGWILSPVKRFEQATAEATARPGSPLPEDGDEEYVRLARAANRLLSSAETAVEREQQFSEDLTHLVRTPLAIVRGSLEQPGATLMQRDITRDQVLREVIRLQGLMSDLVVLQHAQRPGFLQPADVEVEEFFSEFVGLWRDHLGASDAANVSVHLGPMVSDFRALIDEPRLARALDELTANALHASETGGSVWVSTAAVSPAAVSTAAGAGAGATAEAAGWLRIDITDTGRGVPEGEHELITERFARASNDPDPGVGLGLSVADELVRAMGGTLRVLPNEDSPGATARVELPLPHFPAGG